MRRHLPAEITRVDTVDGVRYVLPARPLGKARWFGLLLICFGGLFSGFAVFWMVGASGSIWDADGNFQWFGLPFTLFGVPFVLAGLLPAAMGLAVLMGRNEAAVRDGNLIATEKVGPLPWRRKRPIEKIATFEIIATDDVKSNRKQITIGPKLAALRATGDDMKMLVVAWGYPKKLLHELAAELAERCDARGPARLFEENEPSINIVERALGEDDDAPGISDGETKPVPDQPTGSRIILDRHDGGITLTIPSAGVWKGSKGLFSFALFWCGFMSVFTPFWFFGDGPKGWSMVGLIVFLAAFWAIGIVMLLGAINMGRRRAILDVVGSPPDCTLLITRQNIFGTKQRELHRDAIAAIRMDNSGMEVNDMPVKNLQVHPKEGKKLGLFAGRDDDELAWLATVLRNALDVPKRE